MPPIPILALIPAYNEARRIAPVIRAAQVHLPVLVVDDGSSDETAQTAEAAGAVVLRQVPNQGKGAALRAGFRHALAQGCQAVLTLDADGQHDPAEIPAFLAAHRATGTDLIIGARDFTRMPFIRRLANTLGQGIFSWALGQPVRDNQSGYRLISRRLVEAVLESQEQGFEFEVEMIVTCTRRQYRMEWVSIQTIYRDQGSHIRPIQHMKNFFRISWKTYQSRKANQT